jgi:UDP-3-O-[3-hydroxymyristoyl] N-acetylglucosamine deacetylase
MITNTKISSNQKTLASDILFSGIGLHTGKSTSVRITADLPDSGITFIRSDLNQNNIIKALWTNVSSTILSTTIANKNFASVSTIEHLMSALSGMHIDNAKIYVDGPEIPIMDGSSMPFVELIEKAKLKEQNNKRKIIKVLKEIEVNKGDSFVRISPSNQFSIDFEIEFKSHLVNKQSCQLQLLNGNYKSDISSARTFGFEKDVNELRARGLALGGSLDNAVVVGQNTILNKNGLRYKDEFVRHKILDSIGDLYLSGHPVEGYFFGKKSGHFLNSELLKKLLSDKENYKLI